MPEHLKPEIPNLNSGFIRGHACKVHIQVCGDDMRVDVGVI